MGDAVDHGRRPVEVFADVTIEYEADDGTPLIGEATTSWSYAGPGLRLSMEFLGPGYSLTVDSLANGVKPFFSREVCCAAGEDL